MKITSRDNQKIKHAKKARDGKAVDVLFVEGMRLAEECLNSNLQIFEVFYTASFKESERGELLLKAIAKLQIDMFEVSEQILASISDTKTSQGIILLASKPKTGTEVIAESLKNSSPNFPLFVLLHQVNNPNNLGAILRTAEAAGVHGVLLTEGSANAFSPKALRASMGAAFRLPIWEKVDFSEALDWANKKSLRVTCADINSAQNYSEIDWKQQRLIVFGSEAHGLSTEELEFMDERVYIPMENSVESLNLAVSVGIILFEARRSLQN